jgi:hypothetical protein
MELSKSQLENVDLATAEIVDGMTNPTGPEEDRVRGILTEYVKAGKFA